MSNYIYILREREFINSKNNIYKIGKSVQENLKRFKSYPKGSELIMQLNCSDCNIVERNIIDLFKEKYTQKKDIGIEYFEGDVNQMKHDIYNECNKYKETNIEDVEVNEWTKDDVIFGGNNNYIKICDNITFYKILYLTSDCVKNGKIISYEEYDIKNNDIIIIIRQLFNDEKIKIDELYNIITLIDLIDSKRNRITVDGFNEAMNEYDIDINFNYKNIINFSNKMVEKLDKIFYGDIILNNTFILSFCKEEVSSSIFDKVRYKFFCRFNKKKVSNDFEMIIWKNKRSDNKQIVEIFDNKNDKLRLSKSALEKLKLIEKTKKIHEKRYKTIKKQLSEINGKNTNQKYFTSQLYNRYINVGLHMFINDYHNNIDCCQNLYKNVGDYMDEKYSIEIRKVCMNDELYNKLGL